MKLAGNPAAFFFLGLEQALTHHGEGSLGELPLRYVYRRTDVTDKGPVCAKSWHSIDKNPAVLSILPPEPILHLIRLMPFECVHVSPEASRQVFWVNSLDPAVSQVRVDGPPGKFHPPLIKIGAVCIDIRHPNH